MSNSNTDVRVATDATLNALNTTLATLSKDTTLATLAKDATLSAIDTLASLVTANGLLAKDATLTSLNSALSTALGNIVTAINNQSSGSGGSSSGGGITDSNVTIQSGTSNITGGQVTIAGGSVYINNGQEPVLVSSLDDWFTAMDRFIVTDIATVSALHNSFYRGKNLGTAPTEAQLAAIRAGNFVGMWVGDYWEREITYTDSGSGTSVTDTVRMRIAHINYPRNGATPNIIVIPEYCLYNAKMNDSNTNSSGYKGSKMYTTYLAGAIAAFQTFFGSENLLQYSIDLSTSTSAFVTTSGRIVDLLNQYQVFGTAGSYGVASDPEQTQLAIFKLNDEMKKAKLKSVGNFTYWWTRDPYSSNAFAGVNASGATCNNYACNSYGVRPAALIY